MRRRTRGASALELSLILIAAISASTAEAARASSADTGQWFDFTFHGQKVGFMFAEASTRSLDGRPVEYLKRWSVLRVRRKSETIRIESTIEAWSELNGRPIKYEHARTEGGEVRRSAGRVEGGQFVVRHEVGSTVDVRRFPLEPDVYLATHLDAFPSKDFAKSAALSGRAILEEEGDVRPFERKLIGKEKGREGEALIVEMTVGPLVTRYRVLPTGRIVEVDVEALNAKLVSTTRERAVALDQEVDIFAATMFGVDVPIPAGSTLSELVLLLRGKSGKRPAPSAGEDQRVRPTGKDRVELRIRPGSAPLRQPRLPLRSPELEPFLKATPYEQIEDERIKSTLAAVAKDETNAWEVARRINRFVHDHIQKKSLSRAFATAVEVLGTREGDCTEHSVLFSTLAKAAGIPTRLLTGLVYVGGPNNLFGYHEWVEVWMGDRWVPMDPTFGQDLADATHIVFTRGSSDLEGLQTAGAAASGLIGELEIKVVEWTTKSGEREKQR